MVKSIGLDLVDVARIRNDLQAYGRRFLERVLGPEELAILAGRTDSAEFVAGRFAAKEAVIKGLGNYLQTRPAYRLIQILPDSSGQPTLRLPLDIEERLGGARCLVSITHERKTAAAVAVFVEES